MALITFPEGQWVGFITAAILYGINTVVYPVSLIILLSRGNWSRYKNKKMVAATSILYLLATLNFWLEMSTAYLATFDNYDVLTQSPENTAANVVASIADFIGDLVLMHRLWILWGRRAKIVILPLIASILALISVNVALYIWARYGADSPYPTASSSLCFIVGFILSSAVSLFVTGFIIGRIWWMSRGVQKAINGVAIVPRENMSSIRTAIEVSVESGLVVAVTQVLLVIFFPLQFVGSPLLGNIVGQIYCFAPIMVIVRVGLMGPPRSATSNAHPTRNAISTIRFAHEEEDEVDEESPARTSEFGPETTPEAGSDEKL